MDIRAQAAQVKRELERDLRQGTDQLVSFADTFASDRELLYQALLLKREISRRPGETDAGLDRHALEIANRIVADHETPAAARVVEQRLEAFQQARARSLDVPIPNAVVVKTVNLAKTYGRTGFSLQDVSLEVRFGRICGVVGRNGNGKTTLFRLVVGEIAPSGGTLNFPAIADTAKIPWMKVRRQIAYVPQEVPRWFGSLRSNLHYEAAVHGLTGADNEREVDYIVERLGLSDELDKRWSELAGGFKLRFSLARALVWKPKLLVLDEPLANLDFTGQQIVLKDLRNLANSLRYPLGILISSQHLHEVEGISDDILFLRRGAVVYNGPVEQIGERRTHNTFELDAEIDLFALQSLLSSVSSQPAYHSGVSFVVNTTLDITASTLLKTLVDAGIQVTYFRDISRSTKGLFEEEPSPR